MPRKPIHVKVTRTVAAPARHVYDVLADFRHGHRLILPARAFDGLEVLRGGRGEGTLIRFGMRFLGRVQRVQAEVREPEPGRVLQEHALNGSGAVTTFVVDPAGSGRAEVTIETRWTPTGRGAFLERLLAPLFLKGVFAEEILNLEKVATGAL